MKVLLDTHAFLWWLSDDSKLQAQARSLIENPSNEILVSVVSLWEIAVKSRIGKLDISIDEVLAILPEQGFERLEIADAHLSVLATLPSHHRDPFDHLLIAQSIAEDAIFLSEDANAALYPATVYACSDKAKR